MKIFKNYPLEFDTMSMFRWMNIIAQNENLNITIFYGLVNSNELSETYEIETFNLMKEMQYNDGFGLSSASLYINSYNYSNMLRILFVSLINLMFLL